MPAEVNKCESCRFFHRHAEASPERPGQCRRFPPERINATTSTWPMVAPGDGCGEHLLSGAAFLKGVEGTIHRVNQMPTPFKAEPFSVVEAAAKAKDPVPMVDVDEPYEPSSHELLGSPDPYAVPPGEEAPKS